VTCRPRFPLPARRVSGNPDRPVRPALARRPAAGAAPAANRL